MKNLDKVYEIPIFRPFIKDIWKKNILNKIKWKTNPKTRIKVEEYWGLTWYVDTYIYDDYRYIKIYYLSKNHLENILNAPYCFKYGLDEDYYEDYYDASHTNGVDMLCSTSVMIYFLKLDPISDECLLESHVHYCGNDIFNHDFNCICIKSHVESKNHIAILDCAPYEIKHLSPYNHEHCLCGMIPNPQLYLS